MSIQAQGADGAGTKTAGQVAHDAYWKEPQETDFWNIHPQQVRDGWERAAAAVTALASPRTDSAASTTGEEPWTFDRTRSYLLAELERLKADLNTIGEDLTDDQGKAVSWLDVARGRAANVSSVLTSVTASAPSSPGVPDSVREALEFYADEKNYRLNGALDPNSGNFRGDIKARAALAIIAAHPAGQSAGSGAFRTGLPEANDAFKAAIKQYEAAMDRAGAREGAALEGMLDLLCRFYGYEGDHRRREVWQVVRDLVAPDSTRTGHVSVPLVPTEAMWRAFGTLTPEAFRQKWTDALAVRPAAPEAKGAEIVCDVLTMRLSDGRADYFTRIKCGDRGMTIFKFGERYKAQYSADEFAWLLGLRPDKPDLMAYDEASHPNEPSPPASSGQGER